MTPLILFIYRKIYNISRTKSPNLNVSRLVMQLSLPNKARCLVENEDVVGAAPAGDAPTTSAWSTILLPTKVRLILETGRYISIKRPLLDVARRPIMLPWWLIFSVVTWQPHKWPLTPAPSISDHSDAWVGIHFWIYGVINTSRQLHWDDFKTI